jgi:hypothetical protein
LTQIEQPRWSAVEVGMHIEPFKLITMALVFMNPEQRDERHKTSVMNLQMER